jgi:hypothetical protein
MVTAAHGAYNDRQRAARARAEFRSEAGRGNGQSEGETFWLDALA